MTTERTLASVTPIVESFPKFWPPHQMTGMRSVWYSIVSYMQLLPVDRPARSGQQHGLMGSALVLSCHVPHGFLKLHLDAILCMGERSSRKDNVACIVYRRQATCFVGGGNTPYSMPINATHAEGRWGLNHWWKSGIGSHWTGKPLPARAPESFKKSGCGNPQRSRVEQRGPPAPFPGFFFFTATAMVWWAKTLLHLRFAIAPFAASQSHSTISLP